MPPWSTTIETPERLLLVLLVVGHVLADFLVQTAGMAERKRTSGGWLLWHGLLTWATHLVLVFPFWSAATVFGVTLLGAFHVVVDGARARLFPRWSRSLSSFAVDQAVHVAGIFVVWGLLAAGVADLDQAPWVVTATRWSVIAAGIVFNVKGGTTIVRGVLERYPQVLPHEREGRPDEYAMGRTIGHLERFLVFVFVLLGQWGALGFAIAAKSIARFRELRSQRFADYYLIGTLASICVALATGIVANLVLFY